VADILEDAIGEATKNGWLGKNILGTGFDCMIHVHRGAGAYICGEETALIESLEGKRGNPRIKPPFPAIQGLWMRPTVVNNVETLAAVVPIIKMGGDEYAKIGVGRSTGTKLISACGNINKPGVYEIDMTISVEDFIYSDEYCGGIPNGKKLKACIPGCQSLETTEDNGFVAVAKVKLGPVSATFKGKVLLSDIDAPNSYRISGEGEGGVAGFAKGGADVSLKSTGPSETLLTYTFKAQVGGKMAQLGGRLIDATAKQISDQFFDRFAASLTPAPVVAAEPGAAVSLNPQPLPPAGAISIFALIPSEFLGLPILVWIGLALWLPILFMLFFFQ
jgi:carbon monoxide dehydrogenase subunit G